ncbi:MAG: hypothetical protein ACUVQ2_03935, partial [Dissulfurimicrobium sp.]
SSPAPLQTPTVQYRTPLYFQLIAHTHGVGTVWDGIFMMALTICPDVPGKLGIPKNHTLGAKKKTNRPFSISTLSFAPWLRP